jgi:NADH-quinone oxidoreductase subunit N
VNTSFLAQLSQQFAHFSGQLSCLLAEYILAGLIFVLLLGSFVFRLAFSRLIEGLCWLGLCMNVAAVVYTPLVADIGWEMLVQDGMARYLKVLFGMTTMAVILFEKWHRPPQKSPSLEWHILVIGLLLGAHFMVMAKHLLMMYIGMEIVSICSYLLAGMRKKERFAAEAGMKYLLFGAFSSAMMLYGISWLYGSTGSFTLDVDFYLQFGKIPLLTQTLILLLFLSGFWFKISIVPFHFWTPEVYEGVRYPTAAYFSTIPKVAGIGMLIRFMGMMGSCSTCTEPLLYVLAFLSILTMTWGNIAALAQKSGKRLLAFSAIAHSGFLLMLLLPHSKMGYTAALYYVGIYTLMNFLAFFVLWLAAFRRIYCQMVWFASGLGKLGSLP